MDKTLLLFILLVSPVLANAQIADTINQEASPIIGLNNLAILYYGIEFSKEQRQLVENKEIELIYLIDEEGGPTLSEINGITQKDIIDSLQNKTAEIGNFYPTIKNGTAEPAIYFLKIRFPSYPMRRTQLGKLQANVYKEARLEDFEYINKSGQKFEMIFGCFTNQYLTKGSEYYKAGFGLNIDLLFTTKKSHLFGLNMDISFNQLRKEYPIITDRELSENAASINVGLVYGKWFDKFNVQSEINVAARNLSQPLNDNDKDWVQLNGLNLNLFVNYPLYPGKGKPLYYYGAPSIVNNAINIHAGFRYFYLGLKEANGIMGEIGLSWRLSMDFIDKYKLKDDFLNN